MMRSLLVSMQMILAIYAPPISGFVGPSCSTLTTCNDCTTQGTLCNWCYIDGSCHTEGSIYNPCSIAQEIDETADCPSSQAPFSYALALPFIALSAAAYSDTPQQCLTDKLVPLDPRLASVVVNSTMSTPCATSLNASDPDQVCFAFLAVDHPNATIAIAFRGSFSGVQVLYEALSLLDDPSEPAPGGGLVQAYFIDTYTGLSASLIPALQALRRDFPHYAVLLTGHSLGGSLASVATVDLVVRGVVTAPTLMTFGEPRTGDSIFADSVNKAAAQSFRTVHFRDPIVHTPFCDGLLACTPSPGSPYHHGTEFFYTQPEMTSSSNVRWCRGAPANEDADCSALIITEEPCVDIVDCLRYHLDYFNIHVGDICDQS